MKHGGNLLGKRDGGVCACEPVAQSLPITSSCSQKPPALPNIQVVNENSKSGYEATTVRSNIPSGVMGR